MRLCFYYGKSSTVCIEKDIHYVGDTLEFSSQATLKTTSRIPTTCCEPVDS